MEKFYNWESKVVTVLPEEEDLMIKQMEMFGWSLHGRQEIHKEIGGRLVPVEGGNRGPWTYAIEKKFSSYVKLHFVRPLNLPNLDKIRQIESEYWSLRASYPKSPSTISFIWPLSFIFGGLALLVKRASFIPEKLLPLLSTKDVSLGEALWLLGIIGGKVGFIEALVILVLAAGFIEFLVLSGVGSLWFYYKLKKRKKILETQKKIEKRLYELITEVRSLLPY